MFGARGGYGSEAARRAVPEAGKPAQRLPDGGNRTTDERRGMGTDHLSDS